MDARQALLAKAPHLAVEYLEDLAGKLEAAIERASAALRRENAPEQVIDACRDICFRHAFHVASPQAGTSAADRYRWDYEAIVERIGTPEMRARLADYRARTRPVAKAAVEAAAPIAPAEPARSAANVVKDAIRMGRVGVSAVEIAGYVGGRSAPDPIDDISADKAARRGATMLVGKRARSPEEIAILADRKRARRMASEKALEAAWGPRPGTLIDDDPLDDPLPEDLRTPGFMPSAPVPPLVSPKAVLDTAMLPVRRQIDRTTRAARKARDHGRSAVLLDAKVAALRVRGKAIRAELKPLVEAVIAGEALPWRVKGTRIIDDIDRHWWPAPLAPFRYGSGIDD